LARRALLVLTLLVLAFGTLAAGAAWANPSCAALPGRPDLLPRFDDAPLSEAAPLPPGWTAAVRGPARLAEYTVGGQGRSLLLIGIANNLTSPELLVVPGRRYCLIAQALTDRAPAPNLGSARVQVRFHWLDAFGQALGESHGPWLEVKTPEGGGWSLLRISALAPAGTARLRLSFHPASDDPLFFDELHLRAGGVWLPEQAGLVVPAHEAGPLTLGAWPEGKAAALAFSFDWETSMGGLIHSRSAGDPNFDQNPLERGLRMRQGLTETLKIFAPYGMRATYYATGYNFLSGNRERRTFMGDPVYAWATPANRWRNDWSRRPWFGDDPYTDNQDLALQGAAWYFGDLVPLLQRAGQDIQSHTFAHFYGGFVTPEDWRQDLAAWQEVAAAHGLAGPTSIAFPWSSSGGMSDAAWRVLADAGITSVTRLSDQAQYQLFAYEDDVPLAPRCRTLPGHASILACPDVYLTPGQREEKAIRAIDAAVAAGGAVDIWAHTEEVISPEQIATWQRVVAYAAGRPDLWIAPLAEIAAWQQARARVELTTAPLPERGLRASVTNGSAQRLDGLTLKLPFAPAHGQLLDQAGRVLAVYDAAQESRQIVITLEAGQTLEVRVWPA
jgi:peptidoglycan/xylan/chitin deacetylase (PgdA/CDA1 family)